MSRVSVGLGLELDAGLGLGLDTVRVRARVRVRTCGWWSVVIRVVLIDLRAGCSNMNSTLVLRLVSGV